jgi:hypothetical protein
MLLLKSAAGCRPPGALLVLQQAWGQVMSRT